MPYKEKEKQQAASRRHYEKNREKILERTRIRVGNLRDEINRLKESSPCMDCQEFHPYWRMQFDHVEGEKLAGVNWLVRYGRPQEVYDEIEKCELVCGNCHADRTHARGSHGFAPVQDN